LSDKANILWRVKLLFGGCCFVAVIIAFQIFHIQYFQGEKWSDESNRTTMTDTIEGARGNILDDQGRLLATSLTYYKVSIDPTIPSEEVFSENIDTLSGLISDKFNKGTPQKIKQKISSARAAKRRYLTLSGLVNYNELKEIETWPIFNKGRFAGGLIAEPYNKRVKPFGRPAARTLGMDRMNAQSIGLEASYSGRLSGPKIARVLERMPGGDWVRRFDIKSDDRKGYDIELTLDIELQDIADKALEKALIEHKAAHGCAVVMEVSTGAIKAISNLGRDEDDTFSEKYNYAVGRSTAPGSTFKMVSVLALLESGKASLSDSIDIHLGYAKFYDRKIVDSHPIYRDSLSLAESFIKSSNVAISKIVEENFGNREMHFIDYVNQFGLGDKTGIEINGEPAPKIKRPEAAEWTGVTLPYMSMGYESLLTPLQILKFYNAIANDGVMMKPYLVKRTLDNTRILEETEPQRLGRICKVENAEKIQDLCTEVVEIGTAKSIRSDRYSMAGKTGTAKFMDYDINKKKKVYQASFAGFFPAENPQYSCIVSIHAPKSGAIYGGEISAPVFKEIVEKYLSRKYQLNPIEDDAPRIYFTELPDVKVGHRDDWSTIYQGLNVPCMPISNTEFVSSVLEQDTIYFKDRNVEETEVPNVIGMGIRDALYVLEQRGLRVRFVGHGKVKKQTPGADEAMDDYKTIYLELG